MCHKPLFSAQRGAGLPVALFIITVLALLVYSMAGLQQSSSDAVSLQIQSQRALFAAESGAQVAVSQVLAGDSCALATSSISFSASGLSGCSAVLDCDALWVPASGPASTPAFAITSTGQCGSGSDEAERSVEVVVQ